MYRPWVRIFILIAGLCSLAAHAAEPAEQSAWGYPGNNQKFSIAVIPDTQYLFDQDRYNPEVLTKTLQWIIDHQREKNIVFTVQLGDIVNNGLPSEFARASDVFKLFDSNDVQYGYSAGNHDINGGLYDNVRGPSPYLDYFGPQRISHQRSYCGATTDGYNTCHTFVGGGKRCPSCTEPVRTNPYDRYYAWALVQVHKSGRVSLNLYGFSDDFGPIEKLRKYEVESLQ